MADLKDQYSPAYVRRLGTAIHAIQPTFDVHQFVAETLASGWESLKLMERRDRLTRTMHHQFPKTFVEAAELLRQLAPQFTGLPAIVLPNYVATYGLADWQTSMALLALLTQYSTGEFAIRPFLIKYPDQTAQQMATWAHSDNVDVRRLASEGMRPRLPWGIRLRQYVADPEPVFTILETLITDESSYVQKSVANSLNDISKDHPDRVIAFAQAHWHQTPQTDWMLKRGLRTLFKQGNPAVLRLQGYSLAVAERLDTVAVTPTSQRVVMGASTILNYRLHAHSDAPFPVYLGYRVHYVRQNKTDAFKDFFLKRTTLTAAADLTGAFKIHWRQLSTRRLYPGQHEIDLLVNTQVVARVQVTLTD